MTSNQNMGLLLYVLGLILSLMYLSAIELNNHPDYDSYLNYYRKYQSGTSIPIYNSGIKLYFDVNNYFQLIDIKTVYFINLLLCGTISSIIFLQKKVSVTGIFVHTAFFWPLYSIVLLRGGPAYLLITLATIASPNNRILSFFAGLLACLFHISAIPILLILIINFCSTKIQSKYWLIYLIAVVLYIAKIFDPSLVNTIVSSAITMIATGDMAKYSVYAVSARTIATPHIIYFIILFLITFIYFKDRSALNSHKFIISSIILVSVIIMIVPVVGFRISLFATGTLFLIFPYRDYQIAVRSFLIFLSAAILLFSYYSLTNV